VKYQPEKFFFSLLQGPEGMFVVFLEGQEQEG
jgi:hypothetical protein